MTTDPSGDLRRRALSRGEFIKVLGTGVGGLLVVSGCGGAQGGNSDTITFGAALSLSGDLAKEGKLARDGYKFYESRINSKGGIDVEGKKRKVAVKIYDDQSDPNQAARLYQKLITEDGVQYLLGPYGSSATLQSAVITEKNKLPMVVTNGGSSEIFKQGYKHVFGVLSPGTKYMHSIIDVILNAGNPAAKTVAVIKDNDSFSLEAGNGGVEYAQQNGLEVVANEQIPESSTDVSAVLTRVKGKNPDVLLGAGHFSSSAAIMKTARSLKLNAKAYGFTVGPSIPDFKESLGEASNYVIGNTQWTADLNLKDDLFGTAEQYSQDFEKEFGYAPDYHVAESTAGCYAYQLSMEEANSLDPQKITDALKNLDVQTFFGQVKFNDIGMNVYKDLAAEQWQNGKKKTVWPADSAPAKLMYPTPPWNQR